MFSLYSQHFYTIIKSPFAEKVKKIPGKTEYDKSKEDAE